MENEREQPDVEIESQVREETAESAFRLRIDKNQLSRSAQAPSERESPSVDTEESKPSKIEKTSLGDIEANEQKVSAFEFYFDKIASGEINSVEELAARFINNFNESGFLLKTNRDSYPSYIRGKDENGLVLPQGEQFPVEDRRQQEILTELYTEFSSAVDGSKQAESNVKVLNFYTELIASGKIGSIKELKARFKDRVNSQGYLLDPEDYSPRPSYIKDKAKEDLKLSQDERLPVEDARKQKLLTELYADFSPAMDDSERAKSDAKAIEFYTGLIASGQISSIEELKARFKNEVNYAGFLRSTEGYSYVRDKDKKAIELSQDERVTVEDTRKQEAFIELYKLTTDESVGQEVKSLVKDYLQSGDSKNLQRLELFIADSGGDLAERVKDTLDNVNTIKRQATLKKEFYESLFGESSVDQSLRIVSSYEEQGVEDQLLVQQLVDKALGVRRVQITKDFSSSLVTEGRDFDQSLSKLSVLAKSNRPEDRQYAQELAKTLYQVELSANKKEALKLVTLDADPQAIYRFIDGLPIRPALGELDYINAQVSLKESAGKILANIEDNNRLKRVNQIRRDFEKEDPSKVLSEIKELPSETREEIAIRTQLVELYKQDVLENNRLRQSFEEESPSKVLSEIRELPSDTKEEIAFRAQLVDLYKTYVAKNNPEAFDENFAVEISDKIAADTKEKFISPDLGKNKEAYRYLRENFVNAILPLVESFKDDPRTKADMQKFLAVDKKNGQFIDPKLRFIQRLNALEKQRPLTDTERRYIESVQSLSLFNPYLVAAVNADQGVTSEYLKHHFAEVSKKTTAELKNGDYVPLIQIGTGPNGLAALGEIARDNPELARQMLVVDAGEQPGGPFAIPRGPAWELNSANRRGREGAVLPQQPKDNELKTVRAYGSPVSRWYPGERSQASDTRQGSINTTVDYLPTPDDLSTKRYPTNEELQLILSLQTAMLTDNLALRTSLVKVEPNPNKDERGDKIATLKMVDKEGKEKLVQVKTDALFVSSGLGEPGYGFDLKGSRAEKVLEETKNADGFPKISTTLEAFRAFSDRTQEKDSPGRTLVIWGKGNSADTLIEFVGNIFQGENPQVRDVTKIYIVSDGDLSKRPRYSLISDLKPRNGKGNLIEQVNARVSDVDFESRNGQPEDRGIVLYDGDNNIIRNNEGNPIVADSGIAATGFRSQLDQVFDSYLEGRSLREAGQDGPLQPLNLPTNPDVSVADSLKADPSIVFLGTASKPRFDLEKLAQLPIEAREALLRNGAENAVAIGFRAPDTQAAVNIWLNSREARLTPEEQKVLPKIPIDGDNARKTKIEVDRSELVDQVEIPDNVSEEDLFLSPLLAYELGNKFELSRNFSGDVDFDLIYDKNEKKFSFRFKGGDVQGISSEFLSQLSEAASDEYFQAYSLSLLEKRRRDPKLNVSIGFRRGKVNPKGTFVQTA